MRSARTTRTPKSSGSSTPRENLRRCVSDHRRVHQTDAAQQSKVGDEDMEHAFDDGDAHRPMVVMRCSQATLLPGEQPQAVQVPAPVPVEAVQNVEQADQVRRVTIARTLTCQPIVGGIADGNDDRDGNGPAFANGYVRGAR